MALVLVNNGVSSDGTLSDTTARQNINSLNNDKLTLSLSLSHYRSSFTQAISCILSALNKMKGCK
jgi:hypothetical protein